MKPWWKVFVVGLGIALAGEMVKGIRTLADSQFEVLSNLFNIASWLLVILAPIVWGITRLEVRKIEISRNDGQP
jgi:hypothetical protein